MSRYHHRIIRVLIVLVLAMGAWLWYQNSHTKNINNEADYIDVVRPWLQEVNQNYTLDQVAGVRNKLLNLNSRDKLVGESHINLFLAFDAWQQYLESNNVDMQKQADVFFEKVIVSMPSLHNDIQRLQKILLGDV